MLRLAAVDGFHIFLNNKVKDSSKVSYFKGEGGGGVGVQAYRFGIKDFDLGVGREGQYTSRHFEGSFGSSRAILRM